MKNFLKLLILSVLVYPSLSFAQQADLHFNQEMTVAQVTDQHIFSSVLQGSDIPSYSGLTLLGIVDVDEINPPYQVFQLPLAPQNNLMNVSVSTTVNSPTYFVQFFLVDSLSLAFQGGPTLFNAANGSSYQTFLPTSIWNNSDPGGGEITDEENDADPQSTTPPGTPGEGSPNPIIFATSIDNPLGEDMDIIDFLKRLFVNIVKIAFPFLVLFMMWSGFMFVEARGNEEKLKKAKKNFLYVVIGALLVLGAWTIATVLKGTVNEIANPVVLINFISNLV